jgi:DNA-binding response OmpR family regulator
VPELAGKRIAIVEDDGVLALALRDSLERAGAEVVYEARDLQGALAAAAMVDVDAAVLDVTLSGRACYPAASVFMRHGVPVIFASADEPASVPEGFERAPFIRKPYEQREIVDAVSQVTRAPDGPTS